MIQRISGSTGRGMEVLASRIVNGTAFAAFTCLFALVGGLVGCAAGALIGQSNALGCARGARVGAFNGALLSMEMLESTADRGQWFLLDIFLSLVNGKVFQEWVGEAMLIDADEQQDTVQEIFDEHLNIFNMGIARGMRMGSVEELPKFVIGLKEKIKILEDEITCAVCLQGFDEGDTARSLPKCRHHFHKACIDRWLVLDRSCPICRQDVR